MLGRLPCMFSIKESKPHSVRKRMLSNVYSKTFVQSSDDAHDITHSILFDRLLPEIDSYAAKELPLDVYELNYALTMDFISSYIFGLCNSANFIQDVEARKMYLSWHLKRNEHSFWHQELPSLTRWIQSVGIRLVPKWVDEANANMEAWLLRRCRLAEKSTLLPHGSPEKGCGTRPVVFSQLSDSLEKLAVKQEVEEKHSSPANKELHVASELLDHVVAGMDTSAITLTYLFWELSKNPEIQQELRNELRDLAPALAPGSSEPLPSARSIDALPFLHAVIMETLRRHNSIPGSQPRITPSTPTPLAGSPPLPGGVRVSAQAYSLHRNEEVFPDSEVWNPSRWYLADQNTMDEMMRWFWAFGSGGRMCIGKNFAMQGKHFLNEVAHRIVCSDSLNQFGGVVGY